MTYFKLLGGLRSLVGQNLPDAYAEISLGALQFTTSVVKNTQDPVWEDDFKAIFLLDSTIGHEIHFNFYDEDSFTRDQFLGKIIRKVEDLPTKELIEESWELMDDAKENDSKHPIDVSGHANIQLEYLSLSPSEVL